MNNPDDTGTDFERGLPDAYGNAHPKALLKFIEEDGGLSLAVSPGRKT